MALSIKHPEADRLARELSQITGESLTEAVVKALRERLEHHRGKRPAPQTAHQIFAQARQRLARLPVLDRRSADEILGYDERGLPR
jgi:antitoxin VapB